MLAHDFEVGQHFARLTAPQVESLLVHSNRQDFIPSQMTKVKKPNAGFEITTCDGDGLICCAHAVIEANPAVPDGVPQSVSDFRCV